MAREPFPPEEHHLQLTSPPASPSPADVRQHAAATRDTARDQKARSHQLCAHARQLLAQTSDILHQDRAWRDYHAEQQTGKAASPPPLSLLLIEDNPAEIRLFSIALKHCALPCTVSVLKTHSEVLAFVRHQAAVPAPSPFHLIVSDLNVPGMRAEDIVMALRRLPSCQETTVVVFSGCEEEEGQRQSARCGAVAFVRKPLKLALYIDTVGTLVSHWGRQKGRQ